MPGTWEAPLPPSERVRRTNPKEGRLIGSGESDRSIVLCGGSADHMGKAATGLPSSQREHGLDTKSRNDLCKPHCGE